MLAVQPSTGNLTVKSRCKRQHLAGTAQFPTSLSSYTHSEAAEKHFCIDLIELARRLLCLVEIGAQASDRTYENDHIWLAERQLRIGIDNALGIHPQALELRSSRTEVLARNIANADTPGYKARDIDFHAVLAAQTSKNSQGLTTRLAQTNAGHLVDQSMNASVPSLSYRIPLMPSLDGNTVEAQVEQAEFAENSLQFQASLRFLNGTLSGLMTAIRGE